MSSCRNLGEDCRKNFDSDLTIEPRVARAPDLAHPAFANGSQDFIRAEFCSRRKRHFFTSAVQFVTTVNCKLAASSRVVTKRKRSPAAVTA